MEAMMTVIAGRIHRNPREDLPTFRGGFTVTAGRMNVFPGRIDRKPGEDLPTLGGGLTVIAGRISLVSPCHD